MKTYNLNATNTLTDCPECGPKKCPHNFTLNMVIPPEGANINCPNCGETLHIHEFSILDNKFKVVSKMATYSNYSRLAKK